MVEPLVDSNEALLQTLLNEIHSSRKYRGLNLPEETLRDLLDQALAHQPNAKAALKSVREKLHNIVAPYLGDPDYASAEQILSNAYASGRAELEKSACLELLNAHASTRERIALFDKFYSNLWQVTGKPGILLDLACGLHPFSLPWMDLPATTAYYAYDIHTPRVGLINHFFKLAGQAGKAFVQDILVQPPKIESDVALFFKEAHRFEQRQHGCNRQFWQALNVRWLLVSLPTKSLTGRRNLVDRQRRLVYESLKGLSWPVSELRFENELVFCIQKQ